MGYKSLRSNHQQRGIMLQIEGLGVRYYLGIAPEPELFLLGGEETPSVEYVDIDAIQSCSPFSESIDIKGGIGKYASITIDLATCGDCADTNDPATVFSRLGRRGADWWALITSDIAVGTTTIRVDREPPSTIEGEVVHIGKESIRVGTVGGLGTELSPWVLSGCTRGVGGTQANPYDVRTDTGNQPAILYPLCLFKGRRCSIWLNGGGGYIKYMLGEIAETPQVIDNTVSVNITPLPAILDQEIAVPISREVGLVQGYHVFTPPHGIYLSHVQIMPQKSFNLWEGTGVGAFKLEVTDPAAETRFGKIFDLSLPFSHPRHGSIIGSSGFVDNVLSFDSADTINTVSPIVIGRSYGTIWNDSAVELKLANVIVGALDSDGDFLCEWPSHAEGVIRTKWATGSNLGVDGTWVNVYATLAGSAPSFATNSNSALNDGPVCSSSVEFKQKGVNWDEAFDWSTGVPVRASSKALCQYPLRMKLDVERVDVNYSKNLGYTYLEEVATAWHQKGEWGLLLQPLPDGTSPVRLYNGKAMISVTSGDESWYVEVDSVTTKKLPNDELIGYYVKVSERDVDKLGDFGDWPSSESTVRVRQVAALRSVGWGEFVRGMLSAPLSGGIPYGPNLSQYLGIRWPSDGFSNISPIVPDEKSPGSIIEPFLIATSYGLVLKRTEAGSVYIGLTSMGIEQGNLVKWDIGESDCLDTAQESVSDEDIVNVVNVNTNYSKDGEDKAMTTVQLNDNDSISMFGAQGSLDLDLRGVRTDDGADGQLRWVSLATHITSLYGSPRRMWTLHVSHGLAFGMSLGDTVRVTHSALRSYNAVRGITGALGIIIGIDIDPLNPSAKLTILHTGYIGSGWNTAMEIRSIIDDYAITVYVDKYSANDFSLWRSGDNCVVRSGENPGSFAILEITSATPHYTGTSIDYWTLELNDLHNLVYATHSYVESAPYVSAHLPASSQSPLCFLAGTNDLIATADPPGIPLNIVAYNLG